MAVDCFPGGDDTPPEVDIRGGADVLLSAILVIQTWVKEAPLSRVTSGFTALARTIERWESYRRAQWAAEHIVEVSNSIHIGRGVADGDYPMHIAHLVSQALSGLLQRADGGVNEGLVEVERERGPLGLRVTVRLRAMLVRR